MKESKVKYSLAVLLALLANGALGFASGTPSTLSNLQWTVTGTTGTESVNNTCTVLNLDATGDWVKGSKFSIYGGLFCNTSAGTSTTYGVTGTGFVLSNGGLAMFLSIGSQYYWTCSTSPQFSATCKVVNVATLTQIGTPVITFSP